jgi:hypothetical protein
MQVPLPAARVSHFAQQDRAPVAELRHVAAELVPRVQHCERLRARQRATAAEIFDKLWTRGLARVEIDQLRRSRVETDEIRFRKSGRVNFGIEGGGQARVSVIELQLFQSTHVHVPLHISSHADTDAGRIKLVRQPLNALRLPLLLCAFA